MTFVLLILSSLSYGSLPHDQQSLEKMLGPGRTVSREQLQDRGPQVYKNLMSIAFNSVKPMATRWQAFMAMVKMGDKLALPEVQAALKSRDWFMRDAALKVLPQLDRNRAYRESVRSMKDSALVVRSTAVDILAQLKNPNCADLLWQRLYDKENYIRHKSTWIRRHIVEVLAEVSPKGSEAKFVKLLDDPDESLLPPAIKGLERLSKVKMGDENFPPEYRRLFWKKWFTESQKTARN